jgi:hypothetical protein
LDPFRNNISLDIFATGLVDNLVITKTGSPDLPGDYSGAFLSVETKDYPDKLSVNIATGFGYNPQTTFESVITAARSGTDWMGFDDGSRAIPSGVGRTQFEFPVPVNNPNLYQQFGVLGITDYFSSLGVTSSTNIPTGGDLHQLGLIQLGLMGPAQFGNQLAVNNAINEYNRLYPRSMFFETINAELGEIGQRFPNTWLNGTRTAPLNFSQSLSIGNQTKLFNRSLGYMFAFRYNSSTDYDPNSVVNRSSLPADFVPSESAPLPTGNELAFRQQTALETNGWNMLAKIAYKLNRNNSVSLLFMPNLISENNARTYVGSTLNHQPGLETVIGDDQFYVQRRQLIYQYQSEHFIPARQIKILARASYTGGRREVLDFKETRYLQDVAEGFFFFQPEFSPDRRFRFLEEGLFEAALSAEMPLEALARQKAKVKIGGAYTRNTRNSSQVLYQIGGLRGTRLPEDRSMAFDPARFSVVGREAFDLLYANVSVDLDNDIAYSNVVATFAMIDLNLMPKLRMVGGARLETTDMYADIKLYNDQGLPIGDPNRAFVGNVQVNPGVVESVEVLPSINFIYKLQASEDKPMHVRVNYFGSLARPGFRELSPVSLEDYELRGRVAGNPNLEMVRIQNFDFRLEKFFTKGDNISASVFYKIFDNHIELLQTPGGTNFTWVNADEANALGFELEGKKSITPSLSLRGNISLINSKAIIKDGALTQTRRMFGQAPYIINTMLMYTNEPLKFFISGSYNVQGPRIAAIAPLGVAVPEIAEMPQHLIDLNATKFLGEHWSVAFRVRNLINSPQRRAYNFEMGYVLDFDRYTWGPEYNLSFAYKL